LDEQEAEMTYPLLGKLFDASVFNTMETGSRFVLHSTASTFANITKPGGNPQLRNHNLDAIYQLIFDLHERNGSFIGEVGILKELKAEEIALIQSINTQYHLKDSRPTIITN
jgi:hypothetical protein